MIDICDVSYILSYFWRIVSVCVPMSVRAFSFTFFYIEKIFGLHATSLVEKIFLFMMHLFN